MSLPPDHERRAEPSFGAEDIVFSPVRRRRHPRPLDLVLLLLVAWLVVCGATLRRARIEAERGIEAVERAEELLSPAELAEGVARDPLAEAGAAFRQARSRLDSPFVLPLEVLPVLGRQVRSARALTVAAGDIAALGRRAVSEAQAALGQPRGTGPERVALLRRLAAAAGRFERELAAIDLGPGKALVGPLAERRSELADRLGDVREAMARADTVAGGLADLLAGPRRYLVLGANNSEMRAGSGMFLSIGVLTFAGGEMSLGELRPAGELVLAPAAAPPIGDADLRDRWGWLNPNQEWRNLGASPRFPASAELASQMWVALGGQPVDGVLALDPVAVQGLLSATGPVSAAGRTVSDDDVLDLLLHDQYAGIDTSEDPGQAPRRELLGLIAEATLGAVQEQEGDITALATALSAAAAGRHLMAWAPDRAGEEMWRAAGVTGELGPRSVMVAVLNRAANKLDPFLDVDASLDLERSGGDRRGELRLELHNQTPEGESGYVAGTGQVPGLPPGTYQGLVSVNLPRFVGEVVVDGAPALAAAGPDGPTTVVAWPVRLERGASVTHVVRFRLPAGGGSVVIEPSARVPGVAWQAMGRSWQGGGRREVRW